MSENNNGKWEGEDRFGKTCPECFMQFHGRKNQIYCCPKCKARHNNDLAAERKAEREKQTGSYLQNLNILRKVFMESKEEIVEVSKARLSFEGFDKQGPCTPLNRAGERWFKVGDYAYRPIDGTDLIEIQKLV
jgi:hypothetical protein